MKRKAIFLDVDGTLVNYANQLPSSAALAIQKARANGHLVYLCTGRSKAEIFQEIWAIGLDGMIGGNGCYIEHQGQIIEDHTLSLSQTKAIIHWLNERNLSFYLECNSGLYASERFAQDGDPYIRKYQIGKGQASQEVGGIASAFPDMIFGADLERSDVHKISYILRNMQDHWDARTAFPSLQASTWGGKDELALFADLGVANIDKAKGIERLLSYLHIDRMDAYAFGDAKVDIPMLCYCGIGVAMGNAGMQTKAVADYVCGDVDTDGLYQAFVHLGLIES